MQEYFNLLDDIFKRVSGQSYKDFATVDTFGDEIRKNATSLAKNLQKELLNVVEDLFEYYSSTKRNNLENAKKVNGSKLVLGGRSKFGEVQLEAVRKMMLYADTILIPDPVSPWLESERPAERFKHVLFIKQIFMLLQLKPLVDKDINPPPIYVFQSYEKVLEEQDEFTKNALENFYLAFLANYFGIQFTDIDDSMHYAEKEQQAFIRNVRNNNLFIGPSGIVSKTLDEHLEDYKDFVQEWRTEKYAKLDRSLPDSLILWRALYENITPYWHLLENSETLLAQPLVARDSHWHYYQILNKSFNDRLKRQNFLDERASKVIETLSYERFKWLGNVPIEDLAKIRKEGENELFRNKLNEEVRHLHDSKLDDINYVSDHVSKALESLLSKHSEEVKKIEERYKRKHSFTIIGSWITIGTFLAPTLAPFLGLPKTAFGLASKFFWDSYNENLDRKRLSQSLIGVLANSKE